MASLNHGQGKDTGTSRMRLTVCVGSSCHLKGSRHIVEQLRALIAASGLEDGIELSGAFCMGRCVNGVSLVLDGVCHSLKPEETGAFFTENILKKMSGT
ncbi:MAG: (2Fe-2S) ferredoxin domain-containing protein [Spirochaetales bacterium]|jgi:NADH:ubiquinone oxidoreductase subunit E|nr:(2Fe-2S) ferredoxin domain-containing protein [Spirochaetales bacterium]